MRRRSPGDEASFIFRDCVFFSTGTSTSPASPDVKNRLAQAGRKQKAGFCAEQHRKTSSKLFLHIGISALLYFACYTLVVACLKPSEFQSKVLAYALGIAAIAFLGYMNPRLHRVMAYVIKILVGVRIKT